MSQAGGEGVAAHVGVEEYERDCLDPLRTYSADAWLPTELPPLTLDFGHRAAAPRTEATGGCVRRAAGERHCPRRAIGVDNPAGKDRPVRNCARSSAPRVQINSSKLTML
ncbi:hypothetical protein GCM10010207_62510 [Streptomyces atratus]|nr:hypothetical protein GCM10010207_62510 [Streptomyces atratus]